MALEMSGRVLGTLVAETSTAIGADYDEAMAKSLL
jgi:hypothetical protein